MKLSLVLSVLFFFGAVQCSFGSRVKNETAVERPSRESRKYLHIGGYGNRHEEYDSHKQRPNRFKGRRRSKPSTTTPAYDYGDYDDNSSKETKTVYESYFKHPHIGNVGKIFNQKDINDYFLKGNGDYSKLVKDVVTKTQSSPYFENDSTPKLREELNYKTIVSYDKNDPPSPSYNFASKETPVSSYSYGVKDSSISSFSSKNKDTPVSSFTYDDKNTPVTSYSYGNKDISSSFSSDTKGSPVSSHNYGNKETSFPKFNYDSKETPSSYSYGNKDASNYNYYFNMKDSPVSSNKYKESQSPSLNYGKDTTISSYSYGNKDNYASFTSGTSDTMTSNGWSAMIPKYTTTTISPFNYNQLYGKRPSSQKEVESNPLKNYASDFNFDTKPLADIQPTKYTVPYGKFTLKNTDYVSEFDAKGNPIPSSSETMNDYSPEKDYSYDFAKSFYDYNSNNKPLKVENFFNQNPKYPSDSNFGWDWDNKGYASNYDYFGKAYQAAFLQRNPDYSKYELGSAYKGFKYSGPVEVPQPIIVPVPQPYPVKVPIAKPVAIPILKEIKVPIEKVVPYPVVKNVPYPVEKHVPVPVEKKVPVPVPQPYPVKIPIIKNIYHHAEDHDEPSPPKRPNRQRGRGKPRERPNSDRRHPNRHRQNRYQDKHRDQFDEQDEIHEQYEEYYHEDPYHHRGHHHHYDRFHDRRRHS